MVNNVRNYSSTTLSMALLGAVDVAATVVSLDSLQGLPDTPFTLILSAGTTSEEVVLATEVSGSNVTVTRAQAGTTARSHTAGAPVVHGVTGEDLQGLQDHVQGVAGVHGVAGSLVGLDDAQTLTNKEISGADNTLTDIPGTAILDLPATKLTGDVDATTLNGNSWTASAVAPVGPVENDVWIDIS